MINSISLAQYDIKNFTPRGLISGHQSNNSPAFQPSLYSPPQNSDRFSLDHFSTLKLGGTYTKSDALLQIWRDAHSIDLNDPNSFSGLCFRPTKEDLNELAHRMETHRAKIDFNKISNEFSELFSTIHVGNLGDAIDELASRVVALEGQVGRTGSDQMEQIKQLLERGKESLIDSYTSRLKDALCLSDADAQAVRTSLDTLIDQRLQTYRETQSQISDTLSGTQDEWLLNQNKYMASQLCQSAGGISDSAVGGEFSLGDLRAAGEIAGAYQAMYQKVSQYNGGDEAFLALDLSMIDMKMKTLIQKGIVSDRMAGMLHSSLEQRHQNVMNMADQQLTLRREQALSGDGPTPNLNRNLFQSIYDTVLDSFHHNGGDALSAIRDGVSFGKTAITQANKENPKVSRWGVSKDDYWAKFYTSFTTSGLYGDTRVKKSEYQKYADSWQHFLSTIPSKTGRFLSPHSQELPSYAHNLINTLA